jgi:hypothetical protein
LTGDQGGAAGCKAPCTPAAGVESGGTGADTGPVPSVPSRSTHRFLPALALLALVVGFAITAPARAAVSGSGLVSYAERYLGAPYVWGATGPKTFDCSGFTSFVFAHFGVTLPRTSYDQMKVGKAVTASALREGDLLFWDNGGHVGIYTGDDSFISATVHKGVAVYPLSVWRQTQSYTTARRVIGSVAPSAPVVAPKPVAKPKPRPKPKPKKKAKPKPKKKAKPRAKRTGPGGAAPGAKIPVPKPKPVVGPGGAAPPA